MKRYFITGAQGFVGRYLIRNILETENNSEILGIGRSRRLDLFFTHAIRWAGKPLPAPLPPSLYNMTNRYQYVAVDAHCQEHVGELLRAFQPDIVVHLASGLRDDSTPSLLATNVEGTLNLMHAVAKAKESVRKIIIGSTGGVYGIQEKLPIDEQAPCDPVDLYSVTKLAAEHASRIVAHQHGLPVIWARLFNLAGPGQDERHICGRLCSQAAAILEDLAPPVIDVQSVHTTRDFIDVRDAASALIAICDRGIPSSIYNVGSGIETRMQTVLDLTLEVAELTSRVTVRRKPGRSSDIQRHAASIERLRSLGFKSRYSLAETVREILDYYRTCVGCHSGCSQKTRLGQIGT